MRESFDSLQRTVLEQVQDEFERAAETRGVRLDAVNRGSEPRLQYRSTDELVRHWLLCADAVAQYAVDLGLMSAGQVDQFRLRLRAAHPDLLPGDWFAALGHFAIVADQGSRPGRKQSLRSENDSLEEFCRKAKERVREEYERIARVMGLRLDVINREVPKLLQYRSMDEVERDWSSRAGGVAGIAVALRLITPGQSAQIIRDFQADHPEAWGGIEMEPPGSLPRE